MTGGSGIHLFYVRFFQWISIAVSFEKEISQCDDDFFFVCNKSTARIFIKELGYAEGRIVDESEVESFLNKRAERSVNVYVQASELGFSRELTLVSPPALRAGQKDFFINVYPDGYTNKVYFGEKFSRLPLENDYFHFGSVYTFDVPNNEAIHGFSKFRRKTVFSASLRNFTNLPRSIEAAEAAFREIEPYINGDLVVVMLRPWGSEKFLQGRFHLADGVITFSSLLSDFIQKIVEEVGPHASIGLRPDNRAPQFCRDVITELSSGAGGHVFMVGENWPEWMTFEPFLEHFFNYFPNCRIHTVCLDSTGTLPFIARGMGATHYVGFPSALIPEEHRNSDVFRMIREKVSVMRTHIDLIEGVDLSSEEIADGFFRVKIY